MWEFEILISVWLWTSDIKGLFIKFSEWDEERVYVKRIVDRDDMEFFFDFDK